MKARPKITKGSMMKLSTNSYLAAVAVACAGTFSAPMAFAQGTFTAAAAGDTCNPGTATVASNSCTKGTVTANMQAWGFTSATSLSSTAATGFTRGSLGDHNQYGFGAYTGYNESGWDNQHAFDNFTTGCGTGAGAGNGTSVGNLSTNNSGCGGSIEALFMDFGTAKVNLTDVGIGYNGGDADLSVWAWTGTGNANMAAVTAKGSTTATGTTAAALSGWTLVSNHDFGAATGVKTTGGTIYSSYFLITTYFGAASGGLTAGNDKFKIDQFTVGLCTSGTLTGGTTGATGTATQISQGNGNGATCAQTPPPSGVPEPGSLALAGLALVGVAAVRRRATRG